MSHSLLSLVSPRVSPVLHFVPEPDLIMTRLCGMIFSPLQMFSSRCEKLSLSTGGWKERLTECNPVILFSSNSSRSCRFRPHVCRRYLIYYMEPLAALLPCCHHGNLTELYKCFYSAVPWYYHDNSEQSRNSLNKISNSSFISTNKLTLGPGKQLDGFWVFCCL